MLKLLYNIIDENVEVLLLWSTNKWKTFDTHVISVDAIEVINGVWEHLNSFDQLLEFSPVFLLQRPIKLIYLVIIEQHQVHHLFLQLACLSQLFVLHDYLQLLLKVLLCENFFVEFSESNVLKVSNTSFLTIVNYVLGF